MNAINDIIRSEWNRCVGSIDECPEECDHLCVETEYESTEHCGQIRTDEFVTRDCGCTDPGLSCPRVKDFLSAALGMMK